jgi:hypothetical protein
MNTLCLECFTQGATSRELKNVFEFSNVRKLCSPLPAQVQIRAHFYPFTAPRETIIHAAFLKLLHNELWIFTQSSILRSSVNYKF